MYYAPHQCHGVVGGPSGARVFVAGKKWKGPAKITVVGEGNKAQGVGFNPLWQLSRGLMRRWTRASVARRGTSKGFGLVMATTGQPKTVAGKRRRCGVLRRAATAGRPGQSCNGMHGRDEFGLGRLRARDGKLEKLPGATARWSPRAGKSGLAACAMKENVGVIPTQVRAGPGGRGQQICSPDGISRKPSRNGRAGREKYARQAGTGPLIAMQCPFYVVLPPSAFSCCTTNLTRKCRWSTSADRERLGALPSVCVWSLFIGDGNWLMPSSRPRWNFPPAATRRMPGSRAVIEGAAGAAPGRTGQSGAQGRRGKSAGGRGK